jgi:FAD:protein FMN transferase
MGTTLHVAVAASGRAEAIHAIDDALAAVERADRLLSTWRDDSEIARLNHAPPDHPIPLSSELYLLLEEAQRWSHVSADAFDPAIGSLVDAWDLRGEGRVPSPAELAQAREAAGFGHFVFSPRHRTISRNDAAAWIDTGGFGKGVALREARRVLMGRGIRSAVLNFGGQILTIGSDRGGADWTLPVAHPSQRGQPVALLHCRNCSASTSSQSERFVTVGGQRFGHVVDPRSGEPVPSGGSATVIAQDPVVADIVSTALLVLGPDAGLEWARARTDVGVLFLIEGQGGLERRWNRAMEAFLSNSNSMEIK